MKKYIAFLIGALLLLAVALPVHAQPPFNPPDPYTNGNGQGISGGGLHNAPIGGGLGFLLILSAAYGIRQVWKVRKQT